MLDRVHVLVPIFVVLGEGSCLVALSASKRFHRLQVFIESLVVALVVAFHVHLRRKIQLPGDVLIFDLALVYVEALLVVFSLQVLPIVQRRGLGSVSLVVYVLLRG